jgi:uncharacterized protein YjiS (DUF1127 family)
MSDHTATLRAFTGLHGSRSRPASRHRLALMLEAWRSRHILAELDPRLLKDIGISRGEAQAEIARAPWDIEPRR